MTKFYSIRDRLVDYFQQPFVGPNDKAVMAAMSKHLSEGNDAICHTPHQFELWTLAQFDEETGDVTKEKQLICTCDSLIRPGVREGSYARRSPVDPYAPGNAGAPAAAGTAAGADSGAPPDQAPAKALEASHAPEANPRNH